MEKKKINLGEVATEAGKGVATLFGKTKDALAKAADQTGDGTFDKEDVSVIAENVSTAAKNAADKAKIKVEEMNRVLEINRLRPIMPEDLVSIDFRNHKLICLTEMDKQHAESEVCQGSIGYMSTKKGLDIIHIFRGHEDVFGLTLSPDADYDIYYRDPVTANTYIALDEYFYLMKVARVSELKRIAQDLGATYFRVTYREEKKTFSKKDIKGNTTVKQAKTTNKKKDDLANAEAEHHRTSSCDSKGRIEAESRFAGCDPTLPTLCYLQNDPIVKGLIEARMNRRSPTKSDKYKIELSQSCGIKAKDAANIDGALKALGFSGNTTVTSEVQNESRRWLELEIEF